MSTVRRYTAEGMADIASKLAQAQSFDPWSNKWISEARMALSQAAETEAKAMGLVAQLEIIASDWENTANFEGGDDYTFGRMQVATLVIEEIREALSKFRGEYA